MALRSGSCNGHVVLRKDGGTAKTSWSIAPAAAISTILCSVRGPFKCDLTAIFSYDIFEIDGRTWIVTFLELPKSCVTTTEATAPKAVFDWDYSVSVTP